MEFRVLVDDSYISIGSVLTELMNEGYQKLVYYASRRMFVVENNYSTMEKETL